ncbi:uroporphyrinogen-III synthase [Pseudarthrobacter sp. N5]|uniref:uroporphyrinogen-III synthase n=1 Tax=Pseudarthrobacter sp. N5 TaxID=3418416 RepID=UPI003CFA9F8E
MGRHSTRGPETAQAAGPEGGNSQKPLDGVRVLITRGPDRAEGVAAALRKAGADPLLLPLIDFERARDQHSLDVAVDALGAGAYNWLVVSSITTVQALQRKAAERGMTLAQCVPQSTMVAAIGLASRRFLESEGIAVDLAPDTEQSAAGLLAVWPLSGGSVLLPQSDIAAPALSDGMRATGSSVQTIAAYCTVDYPAHPARRLRSEAPDGADISRRPAVVVLKPDQAKMGIDAGQLHAVVAASPSAVRRIHAVLAPLGSCRLVAIGQSTAAEAGKLGLDVASVASDPTPEGVTEAVIRALLPRSSPAARTSPPPHISSAEQPA